MNRWMSRLYFFAVMATGLLAAACQEAPATQDVIQNVLTRDANVERIQVVVFESAPPRVQVTAYGYLPDGCTSISGVNQSRDGSTLRVRISTSRPAEAMCTQMLVRFQEVIQVDTAGLPSGAYTLDVNGKTEGFTLP